MYQFSLKIVIIYDNIREETERWERSFCKGRI